LDARITSIIEGGMTGRRIGVITSGWITGMGNGIMIGRGIGIGRDIAIDMGGVIKRWCGEPHPTLAQIEFRIQNSEFRIQNGK
jgi:hypothetical protein